MIPDLRYCWYGGRGYCEDNKCDEEENRQQQHNILYAHIQKTDAFLSVVRFCPSKTGFIVSAHSLTSPC